MPTNWDDIANQAGESTDNHFKDQISKLSKLNNSQVEDLINETGISKADLTDVLKAVKDSTKSNTDTVNAIKKINKGVEVLVEIARLM